MQDTSKNCGYNNRSVRGERACLLALLSSSALTDHEHCVHRDHDLTSMGQRPRCYCSLQLRSWRQQNALPATCNRFLEIVPALPGGQVDSARVGSLSSEDKPIWTQLPQRHLALLWTRATCKTSFILSSLPNPNPLQPTCMRSPKRLSLFKRASWRPQASIKLSASVAAACD